MMTMSLPAGQDGEGIRCCTFDTWYHDGLFVDGSGDGFTSSVWSAVRCGGPGAVRGSRGMRAVKGSGQARGDKAERAGIATDVLS